MCMEGIKIGRRTEIIFRAVPITNAWARVLSPNPNRIAVLFGGHISLPIFLKAGAISAGFEGLLTSVNAGNLLLRIEDVGQMVTDSWFAVINGVGTLHVYETLYTHSEAVTSGIAE